MKLNRVMWGVILLFVGIVLLLDNFNVIEFYWRNVWAFWPVFLIISGVNILFNKNKSETGNIISISVLVLILGFVFYKGQERPANKYWFGDRLSRDIDIDINDDKNRRKEKVNFSEPMVAADSLKKTVLNISGGGTSFDLKGETNELFVADAESRYGNFMLQKESTDSVNTLTFKMKESKNRWSLGDDGNEVEMMMNKSPEWIINMNMGAGAIDMDFSEYKLRSFRFDGGAAALDIKIGNLLPVTDVVVKSGMAAVEIKVPKESGCVIKTKAGLSARDFEGFVKIDNGNYETPNYKSAAKKIFINLDGGLTNFEVNRY
jgi:hypothetical protein